MKVLLIGAVVFGVAAGVANCKDLPADWKQIALAKIDEDVASGKIDPAALAVDDFDPATNPARLEVKDGVAEVGIDPTQGGGILGHLKRNWGKYLTTIAIGVTADRVAANNDWLYYGGGDKGESSPAPKPDGGVVAGGNAQSFVVRDNSGQVNFYLDSFNGE